jgi:hypothetical protein
LKPAGDDSKEAEDQISIGSKPDNYEQTCRQYLQKVLYDPASLKDFTVGDPVKSSCTIGGDVSFRGWRVPVTYNVKDRTGAYVGTTTEYFWFHGETLQAVTFSPSSCPTSVKGRWLNFKGGS